MIEEFRHKNPVPEFFILNLKNMAETKETKIVAGIIYKGIEKKTGREVEVTLVGGPGVPMLSIIDEDSIVPSTEVTILEPVGDKLGETFEE